MATTKPSRPKPVAKKRAAAPGGAAGAAMPVVAPAKHWTSGNSRPSHPHPSAQRRRAAQALKDLRRLGVHNGQIRALVGELREEVDVHLMTATWRSPVAECKLLRHVARLSTELSAQLGALSPRAIQPLQLEMSRHVGDCMSSLPSTLLALGLIAADLAKAAPPQSRRRSRTSIVARVHKVLWAVGPQKYGISAEPKSRFARACQAAFTLTGAHDDSTGAIRAYLNRIGTKSTR